MVAEWLRRWTRNPMGFPRVGSNPAHDDDFYNVHLSSKTVLLLIFDKFCSKHKVLERLHCIQSELL